MKNILGIELGSTRIKAVLINEQNKVLAQGSYEWKSSLIGGYWSYSLEEVDKGVKASYKDLLANYKKECGVALTKIDAIGVSAMMHGYLAFDKNDNLLTPFRTWQNVNTEQAADELTELFKFNIPMRWSIAHYYQAILNKEEHVKNVSYITTLAGYVHYKLTGNKVLGIGDASGMFPIKDGTYNAKMVKKFDELLVKNGIKTPLISILPKVLIAGETAGVLTKAGACYLDETGCLEEGAILCPPEGDAGTGMVATNSVSPRTANVSAGTSAFLMAVLEKDLDGYYKEIDVVTTPSGAPVAMVHVNNFTLEMTAWTNLFSEVITLGGGNISRDELFTSLYKKSLESDDDLGNVLGFNFLLGEPIVGVESGVPIILRNPSGNLTLANFMKMQIYTALGALSMGCEILYKENVKIDGVCGHGGFFKTEYVGQSAMSIAVGAPVTVMQNAGEGGAYGMALLALFTYLNQGNLQSFLNSVFKDALKTTVTASEKEVACFKNFMQKYKKALPLAKTAYKSL